MRPAVLLLLTLTKPGIHREPTRYDCQTKCGTFAIGVRDTCKEVQEAENVMLASYAAVLPPGRVCGALDGVVMIVAPDSARGHFWSAQGGPYTKGLFHESDRLMVVADVPLKEGAYVHEAGHVIDHALGFADSSEHAGWRDRGYCVAAARFWAYFNARRLDRLVCG